jgi:hypothetical protein
MDVNEHERLSNITLIKVNEQLVVRKDMDVTEHERLSNIRHLLKVSHVHLHPCPFLLQAVRLL